MEFKNPPVVRLSFFAILFLPVLVLGASKISSSDENVFRYRATGAEIPNHIAFRIITNKVADLSAAGNHRASLAIVGKEMSADLVISKGIVDYLTQTRQEVSAEMDDIYRSLICENESQGTSNIFDLLDTLEDIELSIYEKHYHMFLVKRFDPGQRQRFADWIRHEKWGASYVKMDHKVLWGNDTASASQSTQLRCASLTQEG